MIITDIKPQKKSDRFSVFIDGEYSFSLIKEDLLFFKIKKDEEISKKTYDYIIDTVVYIKAQDAALKFLAHKMRTGKEIRRKLKEKEYSENVIEKVEKFLIKYNYINDFEYCLAYIRQSQKLKPLGSIAIKQKLRFYGVDDSTIEKALSESDIDETGQASQLLDKKMSIMDNGIDAAKKRKLQDFLLRRGYSYDIIRTVFKNKGI
ncbi:MAG: recombination regulator RecX [Clostridia bacterium]|jgi:regulatory protein|nr:recombination regulator RecX [Clostridia bacterium]